MNYQPKGGMCATCARQHKDCRHLPFNEMQVLSKSKGVSIVRCAEYKRVEASQ
ncbi:hypothetical protein [Halomonas sp. MES3-P3E]|uniref:hypothetical protein n=1 Tax=Halomonas sp. MES3-P3E TaxID=2058321 RepID=UPI0012FEB344|nr:hypothetical protein [Halomonas sp. MES3-P3E]